MKKLLIVLVALLGFSQVYSQDYSTTVLVAAKEAAVSNGISNSELVNIAESSGNDDLANIINAIVSSDGGCDYSSSAKNSVNNLVSQVQEANMSETEVYNVLLGGDAGTGGEVSEKPKWWKRLLAKILIFIVKEWLSN